METVNFGSANNTIAKTGTGMVTGGAGLRRPATPSTPQGHNTIAGFIGGDHLDFSAINHSLAIELITSRPRR